MALGYAPDDDVAARRVIDQRIYTNRRDAWADLVAPEYVEQTLRILIEMERATHVAIQAKKAAVADGEMSEAEYKERQSRTHHFRNLVQERKQVVREARAEVNRQLARERQDVEFHLLRDTLITLAKAVRQHKQTTMAEFHETAADRMLWLRLDTLRVPHGKSRSVSLAAALEDMLKQTCGTTLGEQP